MGAEYSNDFFVSGRFERNHEPARASGGPGTRKSFTQKRAEEEIEEQVALVARLQQPLEDDDED